ncbi:NAD(P)-binding domain-containing protein (plasmid) [Ensifer adhaerens]|nr:NAD(P)-binding domain-containing protein [Ensifer adhaerens]UAY05587.1 NAD(P)-binding domain-containing protein [Ensifer adhaerens]UAY12965.1 NAD(P)-binding domain-containing protein [Ensifer adhaerens]
MGSAIALALKGAMANLALTVIDSDEQKARKLLGEQFEGKVVSGSAALGDEQFDVCVLAVKPGDAVEALLSVQSNLQASLIISIAAGTSLFSLKRGATPASRLVRVMPNLAAIVRKAVSVGYADGAVLSADRKFVEVVFGAIGRFHWLKSEEEIDIATAITGSGPGFVFSLTQHLQQEAERIGISKEAADLFARQIIVGAGALLEADTRSPNELKHAVASPGGTTAAGLAVFEQTEAMPRVIRETIAAAAMRAKELALGQS